MEDENVPVAGAHIDELVASILARNGVDEHVEIASRLVGELDGEISGLLAGDISEYDKFRLVTVAAIGAQRLLEARLRRKEGA